MYTVFRMTAPADKLDELSRAIDQIDAPSSHVDLRRPETDTSSTSATSPNGRSTV